MPSTDVTSLKSEPAEPCVRCGHLASLGAHGLCGSCSPVDTRRNWQRITDDAMARGATPVEAVDELLEKAKAAVERDRAHRELEDRAVGSLIGGPVGTATPPAVDESFYAMSKMAAEARVERDRAVRELEEERKRRAAVEERMAIVRRNAPELCRGDAFGYAQRMACEGRARPRPALDDKASASSTLEMVKRGEVSPFLGLCRELGAGEFTKRQVVNETPRPSVDEPLEVPRCGATLSGSKPCVRAPGPEGHTDNAHETATGMMWGVEGYAGTTLPGPADPYQAGPVVKLLEAIGRKPGPDTTLRAATGLVRVELEKARKEGTDAADRVRKLEAVLTACGEKEGTT